MSRRGFTFIELVVIIAIVAIMIAIMMPVFAAARKRARGQACLVNLAQLSHAVTMYAQDHDERMPFTGIEADVAPWYAATFEYAKSPDSLSCPMDLSLPCGLRWPLDAKPPKTICYGYNAHIGGDPSGPYKNVSLREIERTSRTVLLTDGGATAVPGLLPARWPALPAHCGGAFALADARNPAVTSQIMVGPKAPRARHEAKATIVFADGHAKNMPVESFYVPPGAIHPGESVAGYSPCLDPARGCTDGPAPD